MNFTAGVIKVGQIFALLLEEFCFFSQQRFNFGAPLSLELWSSQFGRIEVGPVLETGTPPSRVTSISDFFVRWPTFPPKKNSEKRKAKKITSRQAQREEPPPRTALVTATPTLLATPSSSTRWGPTNFAKLQSPTHHTRIFHTQI